MTTRRTFLSTASQALFAASLPCLRGQGEGTTSPGLKDLVRRNMLVGAVIDKWQMEQSQWLKLILHNFNLVTLGKLKWGFVRPTATGYDFRETDWMVDFCTARRLAMHGHNLCWNANNPGWLAQTLTKSNASGILTNHIATLMKRYAGRITSWDVVNEPIAAWMGRSDGLYTGPWLTALGPQYIDVAFRAAADADPQPLRVLNIAHVEQGGSGSDAARTATLRLVEGLMSRGVPVQAIGFESHLAGDCPGASTPSRASFVHELRQFGLKILLTEIDVDDTRLPAAPDKRDSMVSECYSDYLTTMLAEAQPERIIFFSPGDQANWYDAMHGAPFLRADRAAHRPGLFDGSLLPKSAYTSVANALRGSRG